MPPRRSAPHQVNTIHITTIAPETAISARRIIDAITLTSALERLICDNVPCWRTAANPGAVTLCYAKAGEPRRHSNVAPEGKQLEEQTMPARSKAQQKAAGAALSAKRGETKKSELKGASREMYESMDEKQLEEFAETKRKGLPEKKGD